MSVLFIFTLVSLLLLSSLSPQVTHKAFFFLLRLHYRLLFFSQKTIMKNLVVIATLVAVTLAALFREVAGHLAAVLCCAVLAMKILK